MNIKEYTFTFMDDNKRNMSCTIWQTDFEAAREEAIIILKIKYPDANFNSVGEGHWWRGPGRTFYYKKGVIK